MLQMPYYFSSFLIESCLSEKQNLALVKKILPSKIHLLGDSKKQRQSQSRWLCSWTAFGAGGIINTVF